MQYIVSQVPKSRYRAALRTIVAVIEAKSSAEAKRLASAIEDMAPDADYMALKAEPLQVGKPYGF